MPRLRMPSLRICIRVVHGNLNHARSPLLVGHYQGDTIAGAEAQIDRLIGGRLTRWRNFGLYPGPIGTAEVVLDRTNSKCGAVVVGLGDVGELTAGSLRRALTRGLLRYAVFENDPGRPSNGPAGADAAAPNQLRLCVLPVGTGMGGVSLAAGMSALLQALKDAQGVLERASPTSREPAVGLYGEIEIIELYEHRAIQTWHEVARLQNRQDLKDHFDLDREVTRGEGGRRRIDLADDRTWWQPMTIVMQEQPGSEKVMRFTVPTSTARAEAVLLPTHKKFVDSFIRQAIAGAPTGGSLGAPGRTLFELLVPRHLKDHLREDRPLRLVLDEETAAYPWELLDDRRPYAADQGGGDLSGQGPPAVRAGLIRQLIRKSFGGTAARPMQRGKALVVGDPKIEGVGTPYPALPHAASEAREVANRLAARGYAVTALIQTANPEAIVSALCAQDWQIVHIAAHGAMGSEAEQQGVVLGDGLILTADMLGQLLPLTPDLVFLNCCHLASVRDADIDGGTARPQPERDRAGATGAQPRLAANLAVKLIDIGVRAVVAAGWAIDDAGAATFAHRFYDNLLDPERPATLGDATRIARQAVFDETPGVTWGAYQVYGEPDWRLAPSGAPTPEQAFDFGSRVELVDALDRVCQSAHFDGAHDPAICLTQVDAFAAEAQSRGWMTDAAVAAAVGKAYAGFEAFEKALAHLRIAVRCDPAGAPLEALEQLANLTVGHAAAQWRSGKTGDWSKLCNEMVDLLGTLDRLVFELAEEPELAASGGQRAAASTAERFAIRGACYKRLAQIDAGHRAGHLENMADAYRQARAVAHSAGRLEDPYHLLSELTARVLVKRLSGKGRTLSAGISELLIEARGAAEERDRRDPSFRSAAARADVRLLEAVEAGALDEKTVAAVFDLYGRAWRQGGSRRQVSSVIEQIDFFVDVLSPRDDDKRQAKRGTRIERLSAGLGGLRSKLERALEADGFCFGTRP